MAAFDIAHEPDFGLRLGGSASPAANLPTSEIIAFHGSPYDFDRFDFTKIGTGWGAQSEGHGLYFAESEAVARWHRDRVSRPRRVEGIVYKVRIKADPGHFLDWDRPLNEQSELVKVGVRSIVDEVFKVSGFNVGGWDAGHFYRILIGLVGDAKDACDCLRERGIPGIRYFDRYSLELGQGTRNCVVFNDDVEIIDRSPCLSLGALRL